MKTLVQKKEILPLSILFIFCLYLFREIVFGGHYLFGIDFNEFYFMMKQFLYDELHTHGSIPYWNPYIFGGIPFWAHFESTIFYPLGFLFWFLPPANAYGYTIFLHFVLAGFFMYALVRSLGVNRPGSFLAASVYICNGFNMPMLYLGHMSPIQSYIWLPAVIYFLNRSLHTATPYRNAAVAGLLWGVQILAGAPQDAYYTLLASMLFLLFSIRITRGASKKMIFRLGSTAFLQVILGAGLAAILILPAFEFIGQSVRSALDSYENVTFGSYPPKGLITALIPHFFGDSTQGAYWLENMPWSVFQHNLYLGILPLFMICFISWRRSPHQRVFFYLAFLALFAVALALGKHSPLYHIAYFLPGFDRFRSPARILVLWTFAAAILAGKGTHDLLSSTDRYSTWKLSPWICFLLIVFLLEMTLRLHPEFALKFFLPLLPEGASSAKMDHATEMMSREFHKFAFMAVLSILFILLMMRRYFHRHAAISVLGALLLFDLALLNGAAIQVDDRFPAKAEAMKSALHRTIPKEKEIFRVGSGRSDIGPNLEMYLGFQTVGGYTALFPHRYYEYVNFYSEGKLPPGWQYFTYGRHPRTRMIDLLNVRYELNHPLKKFSVRETALPRSFIVPAAVIKSKEDVLSFLTGPDFDPMETVVFEQEDHSIKSPPEPQPVSSSNSHAEVTSYRPDRIEVRASTDLPGYLFLSEMYYPGWEAFIDKTPARILRGNYLFRVIPIPRGDHHVVLVFNPLSIRIGTGITLLTLFCVAGWAFFHLRRARRAHG